MNIYKMLKRVIGSDDGVKKGDKDWKDIEYFDDSWANRIKLMATYIPAGKSVMDLGCGKMWLKEFIPGSVYIPVDYVKRNEAVIVCDFNKRQFPDKTTDVVFVSGCLEYVEDYKWFIAEICKRTQKCVISYCSVDAVPDLSTRRNRTWVNDLKKEEVIELFKKNGMKLIAENIYGEVNNIFVFDK